MAPLREHTTQLKTGEACTLRVAEAADAEGILACTRATLEGPDAEFNITRPHELTTSVEEEVAWIAQHREHPGRVAIVAEVDGVVVGLINFRNGERERIAHRGYFGMNVHPDWRGRGVGDALLVALLAWAEASTVVEKVCLSVVASNTIAQGLYRKHGFVEEGRHVRAVKYGDGRYDDDLCMYKLV